MTSLKLGRLIASLASCGVVACSSSTPNPEGPNDSEDDLIGGKASARKAIVLAADENDRYACTGALVAKNVVLLPGGCGRAKAIYVGYSRSVAVGSPLDAASVAAQRYDIGSLEDRGDVCSAHLFATLATDVPGVTPLERLESPLTDGSTFTIYGNGATETATEGQQRSATMKVTKAGAPCGSLLAEGTTGSVALGVEDGVALAKGKLVGVKMGVHGTMPDPKTNVLSISDFADPGRARTFDAALGLLPPAVAPVAGPVVGDACTTLDALESAACGACGVKHTVCYEAGGGARWSPYGICEGEVFGGCAPGSVEQKGEGCAVGTRRQRICDDYCGWSLWTACR